MKKDEMIKVLKENGIDVSGETWKVIQKKYKEFKNKPVVEILSDDPVERRAQELRNIRNELHPLIKDLMVRLKGRSNINNKEINEIINLYNRYYRRSETAGCGSCVARCYDALKKLV